MEAVIKEKRKINMYSLPLKRMLNSFSGGKLKMTLPDGRVEYFGDTTSSNLYDIKVTSENFFKRCCLYGDIGFGEAYMHGEWSTTDLRGLLCWIISNIENVEGASGGKSERLGYNLLSFFNRSLNAINWNTKKQAKENIHYHYDLSNDFFKLMLDETMTYSSGIYNSENESLKAAQINKYESLANMLKINQDDHVLEVGSGWGGNAIYLAKNYKCKVHSITISNEQLKYAREQAKKEQVDHLVTFEFLDFRDIEGVYDKIVSIEMIEAIGDYNISPYFETLSRALKKDGILAIQVITSPDSRYKQFKKGSDWIQKHIFPGSLLPSIGKIQASVNDVSDLHMIALKDIGSHYAKTLEQWRENFFKNITKVNQLGFNNQFVKKWEYYLCYCEAAFAERNISDVQIAFARPNNTNY